MSDSGTRQTPVPRWEANDEALAHLKRALVDSGVPFEALIASDCRRFAAVYGDASVTATSARVLYGEADGVAPLRELDQCLALYEEVELSSAVVLQLLLQVIIECKHRAGLHVFGFPIDDANQAASPLIIASRLAHGALLSGASLSIPELASPLHAIALLVDRDRKGQFKTSDEGLSYKAASALIDFIEADVEDASDLECERVLADLGVLDAFDKHRRETNDPPRAVARQWLEDHWDQYARPFMGKYHAGCPPFQMVNVYCPVLCVDAPLYEVTLDLDGDIEQITSSDLLMTGVRPSGWPHRLRGVAPSIGSEAIVVVTNRVGLAGLLSRVHKWFVALSTFLESVGPREAREMLFEAGFLASVYRHTRPESERYRSDLDLW